MAYFVRRPNGSVQIRESIRLEKGPRSRNLASFTGDLNDAILDRAERNATRPFDRPGLLEKARRLGIAWESSTHAAARELISSLREGEALDPILVGLLKDGLSDRPSVGVDDDLREAAEWLGRSDEERGDALRGLLRLTDAIVQARDVIAAQPQPPYPTIHSQTPSTGG